MIEWPDGPTPNEESLLTACEAQCPSGQDQHIPSYLSIIFVKRVSKKVERYAFDGW
jgi:hypothetical protein